jgi:hypothetical protein
MELYLHSPLHLHVYNPNKYSLQYNCLTNKEEMLYQLAYPELIKSSTPTIGLASFPPATSWKEFKCFQVSNFASGSENY